MLGPGNVRIEPRRLRPLGARDGDTADCSDNLRISPESVIDQIQEDIHLTRAGIVPSFCVGR
jgi:hypothetical protein